MVPLIDLLTGRPPLAATPLFSGQWVLDRSPERPRFNGVDAAVGDRLIGDSRQRWSVDWQGMSPTKGVFPVVRPVAESDIDALLRMAESLGELSPLDATWLDWAEASPLAPKIEDEVRIHGFDEFLEERILFLEAVCRSPRNHLRIDSDLQPVSRARRVAKQAVVRLASHREDWERPTVLGVRPKRVLCLVPDEELDFYENRIAARLVDHLRNYLANRLARIAGILRMIEEADHSSETSRASRRQRDRLFSLWGEAVADESATRTARATQRRLEAIHLRVLAMLDSTLYRGIPRSARVTGLRFTNIFLNDANYRQVAEMWREWSKKGLERQLSDQARYHRGQRACEGMLLFAQVLIARALRQLGLSPSSVSAVPLVGTRPVVHLEGDGGIAIVTLDPRGVILIEMGSSLLRIVPLVTSIELEDRSGEPGFQPTSIPSVPEEHLLILHLPRTQPTIGAVEDADPPSRRSLLAQWNPRGLESPPPAALPVSPWSISSVERVARFLRWHLLAPRICLYPPVVSALQRLPAQQGGWLEQSVGTNDWLVLRRPTSKEGSIQNIAEQFASIEYKRLVARGGRAAQDARANADSAAQGIRSQLDRAIAALEGIELCPVCRSAKGVIVPLDRQGGAFRVICENSSCEASWGRYACGARKSDGTACGLQVPFIALQGIEDLLKAMPDLSQTSAEACFGADLLAVPHRDSSGKVRWLCGECRKAHR